MDIVDFIQLVSKEAKVIEKHTSDPTVVWVLIKLSDGRRLLITERTYREGTQILIEPTEDELKAARQDPVTAYNSDRGESLTEFNWK